MANWGPKTPVATNAADPAALTMAFHAQRVTDYRAMVAANSGLAAYRWFGLRAPRGSSVFWCACYFAILRIRDIVIS